MKYNIWVSELLGVISIEENDYVTFGDYLVAKRHARGLSTYELAKLIDITQAYYSDIERNKRNPPGIEKLEKMVAALDLSEDERSIFFDLAGMGRSSVSPDLHGYIMENDIVRIALRLAKKTADADDWQKFIDNLKQKQK